MLLRLIFLLVFLSLGGSCARADDSTKDRTDDAASDLINDRDLGLVIVVAGFKSDASVAQIERMTKLRSGNSGIYELMIDFKQAGYRTKFFNWNGTAAGQFTKERGKGAESIARFIRETLAKSESKRLVLVGQSWGGHTMLEVAQQLKKAPEIKVSIAFGIDAVSFSRGGRMKQLPDNIATMIHYYTGNWFGWGEWKDEPRVKNVFLGDPANGFVVPGNPDYAAKNDPGAHNAAEWDEKIHADIVKRVALQFRFLNERTK